MSFLKSNPDKESQFVHGNIHFNSNLNYFNYYYMYYYCLLVKGQNMDLINLIKKKSSPLKAGNIHR